MILSAGRVMTTIKSHLSTVELEARYEGGPIRSPRATSTRCGCCPRVTISTRWVYQLVRRYNAGGPSCLGDQRANNGTEATIVTPQAVAALKERIKTPPDDGGLWTGPKVARAVAEEQRKNPGAAVEIWAMDEHRIGL
jgi:hypothetical protein